MTLLPSLFVPDLMRRSLLGAHASDPVVPDRRDRRASGPERSKLAAPVRIGPYHRQPTSMHDRAHDRRAA